MTTAEEIERYLERESSSMSSPSLENLRKAREAADDNAHVAAFFYYRNAVEAACDNMARAALLYSAINHANNLKKTADRAAVAEWGGSVLQTIPSTTDLVDRLFRTQPPTMGIAKRISEDISTLKVARE